MGRQSGDDELSWAEPRAEQRQSSWVWLCDSEDVIVFFPELFAFDVFEKFAYHDTRRQKTYPEKEREREAAPGKDPAEISSDFHFGAAVYKFYEIFKYPEQIPPAPLRMQKL